MLYWKERVERVKMCSSGVVGLKFGLHPGLQTVVD